MIYPGLYSGAIGSLLRQIQEQKSQSPIIPPGSEVSTAPREIVEQPNQTIESPGTERVISVRPEASQVVGAGSALDTPGLAYEGADSQRVISSLVSPTRYARPTDLGAGPSEPQSQEGQPEFDNSSSQTSQPSAQLTRVVSAITPPPPRDYGEPLDLSRSNELNQKADKFIQESNQNSNLLAASKALTSNPSSPQALSQFRQAAPQPVKSQPKSSQVLGISTENVGTVREAPRQQSSYSNFANQVASTLKKAPLSWLATKIFGR